MPESMQILCAVVNANDRPGVPPDASSTFIKKRAIRPWKPHKLEQDWTPCGLRSILVRRRAAEQLR
jgi:hypothetical protein